MIRILPAGAQALCPAQGTVGARPALGQPRVGGGGGGGEARPPWAGTGAGSGAGLVAGSGPLAKAGGGRRGGRGGDVRGRDKTREIAPHIRAFAAIRMRSLCE